MNKLKKWDDLTQEEKDEFIEHIITTLHASHEDVYNKALELAQSEPEPMVWVHWMDSHWGATVYFSEREDKPQGWAHTFRVSASKVKEIGILVKDWEQAVKDGRVIA